MFTANFSAKQQAVFLDVLDQLIIADGMRTSHENFKFEFFQKQFPGISAEHVPTEVLKTIFVDRKDRIAVMIELLSISLAEGSMNKDDQAFLENLGAALGFIPQDMRWMRMWVENMLFLIKQANHFMEG